jgi:hypothetical protein
MTRCAIITPRRKAIEAGVFDTIEDAVRFAGLKPNRSEHRVVDGGLNIVVFEYSLFVSPDAQDYFQIGKTLYGGRAVLYAHSSLGTPADLTVVPSITWFADAAAAADAIDKGKVDRPAQRRAGSGDLIWEWPRPRREFMEKMKS